MGSKQQDAGHLPPLPVFDGLSPASVLSETQTLLANQTAIQDELVKTVTPETATFANTIQPLVDSRNHTASRTTILRTVLAQVHPDKAVRDASRKAQNLITAAESVNLMRTDVANLVSAVRQRVRTETSAEALDAQDRFLLERMHGQYVRAGASIACTETRQRIQTASEELSRLESASLRCITEENDGVVWCTGAELAGVSEDVLKTLKTGTPSEYITEASPEVSQQLFRVPLKGNAFTEVYRSAILEETRQRLEFARSHRFPENVGRLSKIIVLRDETARLQGYDNHAAVSMEDKMADSTADVLASLNTLRQKLEPIRDADLIMLRQMKLEGLRQGVESPAFHSSQVNVDPQGLPPNLFAWDFSYYSYHWKKEHCSLDMRKFAEYFEVWHTVQSILELYGDVFGLDFVPMPEVKAWHSEVVTYAVRDSAVDGTGEFLGYLYLDILARDGKYNNGTHIAIQRPFVDALGMRNHGVSTVICAISRPEGSMDKPVLLEHKDVKSLMHELGHAVHSLVSSAKYGIEHSRDFVEIPSVTMENWAWDVKVLTRLGRHHSVVCNAADQQQHQQQHQHGAKEFSGGLPLDIAQAVTRTKWLFKANQMMRSIHLALFDLAIHSPSSAQAAAEIDTTALWNSGRSEIMGLALGEGEHDPGWGQASFSHILKKYAAGYFAYPLCRVIAADIYDTVFAGNAWDKSAGRRFRKLLLEPGAGRPEAETVQALLGRKPNSDAFLRQILS